MGMGWYEGHNSGNDDLTGPVQTTVPFQFGGRGPDQGVIGHTAATADGLIAEGDVIGNMAGTGSAADETNRYRTLAGTADSRQAPTTNYTPGDAYAAQGLQSRAGQAGALAMIHDQATGNGPSAANLSMARNNSQATGGALAAMAGAHPGSAVAGQQAAGNASVQQASNIGQAGHMRSGEISGAQGALMSGFHDMRNGDLGAMRAQDARSQHMANVVLQQRGMNQNQRLGFENMGMDVRNAQLNAGIYARMAAQRRRTQQGNLDVQSQANASKVADQTAAATSSAVSGGMTGAAQ